IRDLTVTGVQTCALPICCCRLSSPYHPEPSAESRWRSAFPGRRAAMRTHRLVRQCEQSPVLNPAERYSLSCCPSSPSCRLKHLRSEERRVGKECRSRWWL